MPCIYLSLTVSPRLSKRRTVHKTTVLFGSFYDSEVRCLAPKAVFQPPSNAARVVTNPPQSQLLG